MRAVLLALVVPVVMAPLLLAVAPQQPDPPLPDAVRFCHMPMGQVEDNATCLCANPDLGGKACDVRQDNGRPRFCKWMCGHARDCGCCPT